MKNSKPGLKTRIQANLGSFDKAMDPSKRAEGMAEVFRLFPELTEVSISMRHFEFRSVSNPGILIGLTKQTGEWELDMVYIPGEEDEA